MFSDLANLGGYFGTSIVQPYLAYRNTRKVTVQTRDEKVNLFRRLFSMCVGLAGGTLYAVTLFHAVPQSSLGLKIISGLKIGVGLLCVGINIHRLSKAKTTKEKITALMGIISACLYIAYFAHSFAPDNGKSILCGMSAVKFSLSLSAGITCFATMVLEQCCSRTKDVN